MAVDLGLHLSCDELVNNGRMSEEEADSRVITFWGCYLFDKGWSAYLRRPESIQAPIIENTPRPSLNAEEEFALCPGEFVAVRCLTPCRHRVRLFPSQRFWVL